MDAVLNWLWQGCVVAAALSLTLMVLERAGANVRYVVCWIAALVVVGLPLVPAFRSEAHVGLAGVPQNDAIVVLPGTWWTSTPAIVGIAAFWVGIQLFRVAAAIIAIRRARRRSRRFPAHLESKLPHWRRVRDGRRSATLVLSNSVTSAAVLGWGPPMIAVRPAIVRALDADDLDRVLIHEWAHVQRRDDLVNVLHVALRAIAGWHPAVWWIERRLHAERELACDEITVAITGAPKSYAACLMKLSTLKGAPRPVQTAPAVLTRSGLRARVGRIVSPHRPIRPAWSRALAAAMASVLCLVAAAVRGVTLVEVTSLAGPVLSAATRDRGVAFDRPRSTGSPAESTTETQRSRHRAARSSSPRRPGTEQARSTQPQIEPSAPPDMRERNTAGFVAPVAVEMPVLPTSYASPNAPPDTPSTPWTAARAGGTAVGRKSKDAGVATAAFFTRFARRVAGAF